MRHYVRTLTYRYIRFDNREWINANVRGYISVRTNYRRVVNVRRRVRIHTVFLPVKGLCVSLFEVCFI